MQDRQTPQMTAQLVGYPSSLLPVTTLKSPSLSLSAPHHSASLNTTIPSPLISHLLFLPCFHTLLPQPSLLDRSTLRLGKTSVSSLLCDLKALLALSVPLPPSPGFRLQLGLPGVRMEYQGVRGQAKGLNVDGGSSSALCERPPPQPQGRAASLQTGEGLIAVA